MAVYLIVLRTYQLILELLVEKTIEFDGRLIIGLEGGVVRLAL